jgi:hypothetical protein
LATKMVYNKFLFAPPKYRVTRSRPECRRQVKTDQGAATEN